MIIFSSFILKKNYSYETNYIAKYIENYIYINEKAINSGLEVSFTTIKKRGLLGFFGKYLRIKVKLDFF